MYIIREDAEPVDYVAVGEYADFLGKTTATEITLLFRSPNPRAWRSSIQLAGALNDYLGSEAASVLQRIRAYYRHPESSEVANVSLPLAHPYVLLCDRSGTDVASALFDESVKQRSLASGLDEARAAQNSLCIVDHHRHVAGEISSWVGLKSPTELIDNMWVPIELPA